MALTAAEQAELAALEKEVSTSPASASKGLSPQEQAELAALEGELQVGAPAEEPGMLKKAGLAALDYGGRALDYAGGLARTGVASQIDDVRSLVGKDRLLKEDDLWNALKGKALPTSEYLERTGVPAGYSMSDALSGAYSDSGDEWLKLKKGGWADPTMRGAAGFVGDVALDPLTYLTLGTGAAAKTALKSGAKAAATSGAEALVKAGGAISREGISEAGQAALKAAAPTFRETVTQGLKKTGDKALRPLENFSEYFGTGIYKSGLKRIDQEAAKYGKEPVSDVLMEAGITGNARQIYDKMDDLGEQILKERQALLKDSTKAGAEVSMQEAMGPTMARIQQIRASKNPKLQPLADALEKDVTNYLALEAKAPQPILRELPYTEKMGGHTPIDYRPQVSTISGSPTQLVDATQMTGIGAKKKMPSTMVSEVRPPERVIGAEVPDLLVPQRPLQVLDETERVLGPSPLQATGYKSSMTSSLPDSAYRDADILSAAQAAGREQAGGMKTAVENAVEKTTGRGGELKELNDKLGRILTTKDKQLLEAAKEANKSGLLNQSQVDAMSFWASPWLWASKQAGKVTQATGTRTRVGKAMRTLGRDSGGMTDIAARRLFWEALAEKERNQTPLQEQ